MIICIDYDGTYTADPKLWDKFLIQARANGHGLICATMRHKSEGEEVEKYLSDKCDQIIYTSRVAKLKFLAELHIKPDIWIDDNPVTNQTL